MTVLVVDDSAAFRAAVEEVVGAAKGFVLVGQADSGQRSLELADALSPQLVIMDKRMPGMHGVEACRRLIERHPQIVVVLVSVEDPDPRLMHASGAKAFVRKQELSSRLLEQVWREHGVRACGRAG